jgi:hypothetical protein
VLERLHMPSLDGATEWLNAEPLGPAELADLLHEPEQASAAAGLSTAEIAR